MTYERYCALIGPRTSLREALMQFEGDAIDFDAPTLASVALRVPDLG